MISKNRMDRFTWKPGDVKALTFKEMVEESFKNGSKVIISENYKSEAYQKLVKLMKEIYRQFDYSFDPTDTNIPPQFWAPYVKINDEMTCICQEINLYTYWQGLGYAEKTPKIKYLLVGQDYGNIFKDDNKRIIEINAGNRSLPFFETTSNPTNSHLTELFKILGYDDIITRHDELFFTNFCLAYRTGSEETSKVQAKVMKEAMKKSAPLFKYLCAILEPKNILCLGQDTFMYVYRKCAEKHLDLSMVMKGAKKLLHFK